MLLKPEEKSGCISAALCIVFLLLGMSLRNLFYLTFNLTDKTHLAAAPRAASCWLNSLCVHKTSNTFSLISKYGVW